MRKLVQVNIMQTWKIIRIHNKIDGVLQQKISKNK